jgi:hypothetical protein
MSMWDKSPGENDVVHNVTLPAGSGQIWPKSTSKLRETHRVKRSIEGIRSASHGCVLGQDVTNGNDAS